MAGPEVPFRRNWKSDSGQQSGSLHSRMRLAGWRVDATVRKLRNTREAAVLLLQDRVAIVTGASSGIGRAAARLFAAHGAKMVITARRERELETLVDEIERAGGAAVAVPGDIRSEETAEALVRSAQERFGGLDIAFNNAGSIPERAPVPDLSLKGWHETIE